MATNAANGVTDWYLSIPVSEKESLMEIRHWSQLKLAFDGNTIWLKDFTDWQIDSPEVKSLLGKHIFYEKEGRLFAKDKLLPELAAPELLWTPIARALPVALPSFNHNYFGIQEKVTIQLVRSGAERAGVAVIADLSMMIPFMNRAPAVRLKQLQWVLFEERKALVMGVPLLPIPGDVFWQRGNFLLPAGYDFELPIIADSLHTLVNPAHNNWIVWQADGSCFSVNKELLQPLSISSFRKTTEPENGR